MCSTSGNPTDLIPQLLARVDIGTSQPPVIPLEGKARGTTVFCPGAFIGHPQQVALDMLLPAPEFGRITCTAHLDRATPKRLVHLVAMCAPAMMRRCVKWQALPANLDKLRKIIRNAANGLPTYSSDEKQRRCCVSSVLMPYIILFVNIFLMPLSIIRQVAIF